MENKEKSKEKRARRQPEETKRLILDAAESRMTTDGPAGLRLQEVARAAGVSHPTILHYFGSRDGLVQALYLRTLDDLKTAVIGQMGGSAEDGIRLAFAAYRNGLAQRVMWLMQSPLPQPEGRLPIFEQIVQSLHEVRLRFSQPGAAVDLADTRRVVHLITIAAFGDAIIGLRLRQGAQGQSAPASEEDERARFEAWLGELLSLHLRTEAAKTAG